MTLDQLPHGGRAVVTALDSSGAERRRLMDLGVLPGSEIHADLLSPLGDPTAYLVRGSLVVLRRAQARGVHVDPHDGAPNIDTPHTATPTDLEPEPDRDGDR